MAENQKKSSSAPTSDAEMKKKDSAKPPGDAETQRKEVATPTAGEETQEKVSSAPAGAVPDSTLNGGDQVRSISIPLQELPNPAEHDSVYAHRFMPKYLEASMPELMEGMRLQKQLVPIQVTKKDGKWVVVSGHRRLAAMYLLAIRHVAGFSMDMPVRAEVTLGASHQELLLRSAADNELRAPLEAKERLLLVEKFV